MRFALGLILLGGLTLHDIRSASAAPDALRAVPLTDVTIEDEFWAARVETTRKQTLPHIFRMCDETGRLSNFDKAAGALAGDHEGAFFNDSDVYKAIEAAGYALATRPDADLRGEMDQLIARIAKAQEQDGYLNTFYSLTGEEKWSDVRNRHELYCAGHLFEAGIAYHQATGERKLLDVAIRFADLIDARFGPGKRVEVPGHEEIELALVALAQHTGDERYLNLAEFFLDQRGRAEGRELYGDYCQDHAPARNHDTIVGHAVRAMYLYCGMADVAAITGDQGYLDAMARIWDDLIGRKMYITGGIGPSGHNEGFTVAYDLPNDQAYAETCAAIGMVLWNHRLNLLYRDARYVDVLERALYNGVLSGIALDGKHFFYTNPLASRGDNRRVEWFGCACCPPNLARLLLSLGGYIYAQADDALYVNLFIAGRADITLLDTPIVLKQQTRYPWQGAVRLTLEPEAPVEFALHVRIPGWCHGAQVVLNGQPVTDSPVRDGYVTVRRQWQRGDVVELVLPMSIQRIEAHPQVAADRGRVALQRGPIVYCLEGADNNGTVRNLALPRTAALVAEHRPDTLGGVTVLRGTAMGVAHEEWDDWSGALYRPAMAVEPVEFLAIPYYAWANRAPGEMVVWLPESPTLVEAPPVGGITPSASHCFARDTTRALHDRIEPAGSGDHSIPRFTWWDRRGSREWVRYEFDKPRNVSWTEVYWFDDRQKDGGCRVPSSWQLQYRVGDQWQPVGNASPCGTAGDRYNRVTFDPVTTDGLMIEVQLQPDFSGGILEWKVGE